MGGGLVFRLRSCVLAAFARDRRARAARLLLGDGRCFSHSLTCSQRAPSVVCAQSEGSGSATSLACGVRPRASCRARAACAAALALVLPLNRLRCGSSCVRAGRGQRARRRCRRAVRPAQPGRRVAPLQPAQRGLGRARAARRGGAAAQPHRRHVRQVRASKPLRVFGQLGCRGGGVVRVRCANSPGWRARCRATSLHTRGSMPRSAADCCTPRLALRDSPSPAPQRAAAPLDASPLSTRIRASLDSNRAIVSPPLSD